MSIPTPFGSVGAGNAANGLCGGMVYAALDYWIAAQIPPRERPAPGTPLYEFIVRRLIDSWHVPAGIADYFLWMNLPDGDVNVSVLGKAVVVQRGVAWRTIEQHGKNHQVGAYAYSVSGTEVIVKVYDPNSGQNVSQRFIRAGL